MEACLGHIYAVISGTMAADITNKKYIDVKVVKFVIVFPEM
jgi:hypothetical protein